MKYVPQISEKQYCIAAVWNRDLFFFFNSKTCVDTYVQAVDIVLSTGIEILYLD